MKHGLSAFFFAATLLAGSAAFADETPSDETPAVASDDGMAGNVQFLLGQAYLGDFWKPFDRPSLFGVEVDFAPKKSPVRVALAMNIFGDGAWRKLSRFRMLQGLGQMQRVARRFGGQLVRPLENVPGA